MAEIPEKRRRELEKIAEGLGSPRCTRGCFNSDGLFCTGVAGKKAWNGIPVYGISGDNREVLVSVSSFCERPSGCTWEKVNEELRDANFLEMQYN